jgi:hypothetical protein
MIPLSDAVLLITSQIFDLDLTPPVEIWQHSETGEIKLVPDLGSLKGAAGYVEHGRSMVLRWLRSAMVGALVDHNNVLPTIAWYDPRAAEWLRTGEYDGKPLLVDRHELWAALAGLDRHMIPGEAAQEAPDEQSEERSEPEEGPSSGQPRTGRGRPGRKFRDIERAARERLSHGTACADRTEERQWLERQIGVSKSYANQALRKVWGPAAKKPAKQ